MTTIENENVEQLLDQENTKNKTESWNKLNKTLKIQKLHAFAEKHGKEKKYNAKEIKQLKMFFNHCLDKNKLLKTKEVAYDKKTQEVNDVPGLLYGNNNFTIRNDAKRVSTLKSLAPKRGTEKLKPNAENNINTSDEK